MYGGQLVIQMERLQHEYRNETLDGESISFVNKVRRHELKRCNWVRHEYFCVIMKER